MVGRSLRRLQASSLSLAIGCGGAVACADVVLSDPGLWRAVVVGFAYLLIALAIARAHVVARRRLRSLEHAIANIGWIQHLPVVSGDPMSSIEASFDALVDGLAQYHAERDAAVDMITRLIECETRDEVLRVLKRRMRKVFPADGGAAYLANHDDTRYLRAVGWRLASPNELESNAFAGVPNLAAYPIEARGRTIGLLVLQYDALALDDDGQVRAPKRLMAESVARQIGLVLCNLQLRAALEGLSSRDALTGAFNRRSFDEMSASQIDAASRGGGPLSVVMIDVDHFKRFNDRYGHPAGDTLLKRVAETLAQTVRAGDRVCRFGGEEFVVLLEGASLEVGWARAEALRQALQALAVSHDGQPLGAVTASFGVASFPLHGRTPSQLVAAADRALYQAKQSGRNRVCIAGADTVEIAA